MLHERQSATESTIFPLSKSPLRRRQTLGTNKMTKTAATKPTLTTAQRATAKAETMYQFSVCTGLLLVATFAGTAGAFVAHI